MTIVRSVSCALGVLGLALAANVYAGITIKGLKTAMVDCYKDEKLEKVDVVIQREHWPAGPIVSDREFEDTAVHAIVAGRSCWFDRSELEFALPDVSDCVDDSGGFSSRGLGDKKKCTQKKSGR